MVAAQMREEDGHPSAKEVKLVDLLEESRKRA